MKKYINNGTIFKLKPKGGKLPVTVPRLDIPHAVHGSNGGGIGRGEGKDGDIIKKGDQKGKQKGKVGDEHADGVTIAVDLEDVLKFLQHELQLPDLKPKPSEVLEQEEVKYTSISLTGPESLRHNRRTMLQAMKRQAASGESEKTWKPPGYAIPVKMITPINSDRRYRQYKIVKKPSSNAVIFFARDGSASMDQYKCDIISDMCWWIDVWIRRFYKRVERNYIWHDSEAMEVSENKFYRYRGGGGTKCSSALKLISEQFENKYPPNKWNIFVFYFTDGENWGEDNNTFIDILKNEFTPEIVNFVGITEVLSYMGSDSLKNVVDQNIKLKNLRTTEITHVDNQPINMWSPPSQLPEEVRGEKIMKAIKDLLGSGPQPDQIAPAE